MPPEPVIVRRTADDIVLAVAVHVIHIHVGAGRAEVRGVELPRLRHLGPFRLLPPARRAEDVDLAVAVDVAVPQAVREALRAGDFLLGLARPADRDALPGLAGEEVAH